jgi:molybdate transport system substrate-binding protein
VKIFGTFLADSHPPIVYPVAPVAGHERESVARYLQFLRGEEARGIFETYRFVVKQ